MWIKHDPWGMSAPIWVLVGPFVGLCTVVATHWHGTTMVYSSLVATHCGIAAGLVAQISAAQISRTIACRGPEYCVWDAASDDIWCLLYVGYRDAPIGMPQDGS